MVEESEFTGLYAIWATTHLGCQQQIMKLNTILCHCAMKHDQWIHQSKNREMCAHVDVSA